MNGKRRHFHTSRHGRTHSLFFKHTDIMQEDSDSNIHDGYLMNLSDDILTRIMAGTGRSIGRAAVAAKRLEMVKVSEIELP